MSQDNLICFDLCDVLDVEQIHRLPPEILGANPNTLRVILAEDDPWVSKLILLGFRPQQLIYIDTRNSK